MRFLLLIFSCIGLFACAHQKEEPLFKYNGREYSRGDLPEQTQQDIFRLQADYHKALLEKVRSAVVELYLADQAKIEKTTIEVVRAKYASSKAQPTEAEMRAFYEREKGKLPYSYDMVKNEIHDWIIAEMSEEKRLGLLQKIEAERGVVLYVDEPTPPQFPITLQGYPSKGEAKAKVSLVEYADFTCPECQKSVPEVKAILKKYGNRIQYVYKYFPREYARTGERIARGAHCANKQGKFWEYHDYAFDNQYKLSWDEQTEMLKKLKIDEKAFNTCLESKEAEAMVKQSFDEGRRYGVRGTPTFFINGRQVISGKNYEALSREIEEAL